MISSKKKDLVEYKQTQPEQLKLFESEEGYSNTIELYDSMPKYHFGGVEREKGKSVDSLPILNREFMHRNRNYKLSISPAAVQDKKTGKTINYYPSQREEIIEDVIRKISTRPNRAILFDNDIGVKFTYYEVQQELKKIGHGYSIDQIKLGIEILNKSVLETTSKEGNEISITSSLFSYVGKETKEMGGKERVVVIFNPLVTRSINHGTYRLINYDKLMKMKMPLSRWLHKRISHIFTQAALTKPYNILLSTVVRDSGMKNYKTISERMRQVDKALNELKNNDVLSDWKVDTSGYKQKNKILDALYLLYVSETFVADAKKATKFTNIRLENSEEEDEEFDIDVLRKELESSVYRLSKTIINGIISKISTKEDFDRILGNLAAAKDYINKKDINNPAAVVKKSIQEDWVPSDTGDLFDKPDNSVQKSTEEISKEKEEKQKARKLLQSNSIWVKIKHRMEKEFDQETRKKWLSGLELFALDNSKIVLVAPNKFSRDWIICELLGDIKSLIQSLYPEIKEVSIICVMD